jgi:hypothetical protein
MRRSRRSSAASPAPGPFCRSLFFLVRQGNERVIGSPEKGVGHRLLQQFGCLRQDRYHSALGRRDLGGQVEHAIDRRSFSMPAKTSSSGSRFQSLEPAITPLKMKNGRQRHRERDHSQSAGHQQHRSHQRLPAPRPLCKNMAIAKMATGLSPNRVAQTRNRRSSLLMTQPLLVGD